MLNTREKLIELLKRTDRETYEALKDREDYREEMLWDYFASNLIANGVTVQEWISVKDRLPEDNSNVIACLWIGEESRVYPAFYAHGVWWDRVFSTPTTNTTTHWQPMPQPPKGE